MDPTIHGERVRSGDTNASAMDGPILGRGKFIGRQTQPRGTALTHSYGPFVCWQAPSADVRVSSRWFEWAGLPMPGLRPAADPVGTLRGNRYLKVEFACLFGSGPMIRSDRLVRIDGALTTRVIACHPVGGPGFLIVKPSRTRTRGTRDRFRRAADANGPSPRPAQRGRGQGEGW